ncbi:hypothetical protein BWR59_19075 [Pseudomonas sp. Bc-h]|uniref:hypothetical protein n=1 Tax=Pseudomonas sp. Bc-h TaxID=1943632 RepID=UPI0009DAB2AE|nr:hypothetical protein [Pseudomonas sp. Bc-h]OQR29573.1 hypothetical protein BWR59_19075 [Pseudomonas sp. Bc-h]
MFCQKIKDNFLFILNYVALLISLCVAAQATADEANLCIREETYIGGCHLAEKKSRLLSFCTQGRNVIYRIGSEKKLEMEYVFSKEKPLTRWVDKATYTTYFGFRSGRYGYSFGVPQQTFGARAFLEVTLGNQTVMSRRCTQNSFGKDDLESEAIREADDAKIRISGFIFPPD